VSDNVLKAQNVCSRDIQWALRQPIFPNIYHLEMGDFKPPGTIGLMAGY
jgi:hypothetical protein